MANVNLYSFPIYLARPGEPPIPDQTYYEHIYGVCERVKIDLAFVQPYMSADKFHRLTAVILAAAPYHDLGKLWPDNQLVLHRKQDGKMPNHTDAGTAYLRDCRAAAWLVKSHHWGFDDYSANFDDWRDNQPVQQRCPWIDFPGTMREYTDRLLPDRVKLHHALMGAEHKVPADVKEESWFYRLALSILVDGDHFDAGRHGGNYVATEDDVLPLRALERLPLLDTFVAKLQMKGGGSERNRIKQEVYDAVRHSPIRRVKFPAWVTIQSRM